MTEHDDIQRLMELIQQGDDDAANEIWIKVYPRLIEWAKKKLQGVPKQMADEEDVVVSVFESFYKAVKQKRFPNLKSEDDLWKVLFTLVKWKSINLRRRENCRPQNRGLPTDETNDPSHPTNHAPSKMSEEQFAAIIFEMLEDKFASLKERQDLIVIASARLEGYHVHEIAEQSQLSKSTVERKLKLIRDIWAEHREDSIA